MNTRRHEDTREIPRSWLAARLRLLARAEPPAGLRDKLIAAAGPTAAGKTDKVAGAWWPKAARYVAVAAGVLVVASVVLRFVTPNGRAPVPIADINDRPSLTATADHNSLLPRDINVCDNNAVP